MKAKEKVNPLLPESKNNNVKKENFRYYKTQGNKKYR